MDQDLKILIGISVVTIINAGLFLLFVRSIRHREPIVSNHRHPYNLRKKRNQPVDVDEIIRTAEIRIGQR